MAEKTHRVRLPNGLHYSHPFAEGAPLSVFVPPGGVAIIDDATWMGLKRKGDKVTMEKVGDDVELSTFTMKSGGTERELEYDLPGLLADEREARQAAGLQTTIKNAGMRGAIAQHFKTKAEREAAAAQAAAASTSASANDTATKSAKGAAPEAKGGPN